MHCSFEHEIVGTQILQVIAKLHVIELCVIALNMSLT